MQKLRMRKIGFKKDLPVNPQLRIFFQRVVGSDDVTQKEDEKLVQKLRMRKIGFKKDLPVNPQLRIFFQRVVGSDSKFTNYLMN